ncbi:hypothetical protein C3747_220g69 [Trypanosoma cruzi]|uniref:Uncharacterized protein n=2 Tax=Trypanosoma cruzi TaxID=5693 RepID=Q4CN09_TRYCC|nr:hypothetical protein, conserved [Trypanosoma cruzi]EAN81663.1 hypothetical protein, conserved [Trypanosoma cruzi]PWU99284.1 hypothetical protein C3747_220g69 [Trypanosoma cruzi]RNC42390.1 hypothetical protein TcCL_NonESM07998 [Trypanosoma cruzi]|eukprot:XP_803109.1 hypothetical protein [Trypanosoma cruzi strain CL Brener]
MSTQIREIESTLPLGLCGLDQLEWSGQAGAVWECWKLAPCCGHPDLLGVIYCLLHWTCLSPFSMCKLYASSLDDPCSVWPHCFCILCCPVGRWFTRYNLRKKNGTRGNIIGDCCCVFLCLAPCACCQELRSVNASAWRLFPDFTVCGGCVPGCRFLR